MPYSISCVVQTGRGWRRRWVRLCCAGSTQIRSASWRTTPSPWTSWGLLPPFPSALSWRGTRVTKFLDVYCISSWYIWFCVCLILSFMNLYFYFGECFFMNISFFMYPECIFGRCIAVIMVGCMGVLCVPVYIWEKWCGNCGACGGDDRYCGGERRASGVVTMMMRVIVNVEVSGVVTVMAASVVGVGVSEW